MSQKKNPFSVKGIYISSARPITPKTFEKDYKKSSIPKDKHGNIKKLTGTEFVDQVKALAKKHGIS